MPLRDLAGADRPEDLLGELKQTDQVGDSGAIDAQAAGQVFLRAAVSREVVPEGGRLVDRVEVLALEVLHHGQLEDALVVEVEDPGGDLVELGLDAGAEPALASDELIPQPDGPHDD